MKNYILLITLSLLICSQSFAQTSAVDHMKALTENNSQVRKDTWDYIRKATRSRNATKIEKRRKELVATLKEAKSEASRVRAFKGDATLKKAVVAYFDLSIFVMNDDLKKIVDLEKIAEESYDAMEAYLLTKEQVNLKMDSARIKLTNAKENFAAAHNIQLVEGKQSKVSKKLGNAHEIMQYRNQLYLIYFKSSWYERQMIQAMALGKMSDVEQFRQSLLTVTKEGQAKLKEIGLFRDSDKSMKLVCQESLNFLQTEAEKDIPKQIDFYLEKENVETFTKNFESKKQKDLTQKDVDEYNTKIQNYNNSITSFNERNERLNKGRSKLVKKWNKTTTEFYNKHQ